MIKVILQFFKENGLTESFKTLQVNQLHSTISILTCLDQEECQVTLNTVENVESFVGDITNGRWDLVLPVTSQLKLPKEKLEDLYEHVKCFS